jgi:CheY-like chemotaxis protein
VDDNKQGLAARRVVLEELGYKTAGAPNPREALALLREHPFDLIVTDYKMPEMRGDEFIHILRAEMPHLPVVLLSGFVDALGLTEKNTGASAVLMKSGNEVAHLVRAVKHLLNPKTRAARKKPPATESAPAPAKKARAAS